MKVLSKFINAVASNRFKQDKLKPDDQLQTDSINGSQIIKDPLWDLMLSTNDCYPGCGCERDFFDMTESRVQMWSRTNGEAAVKVALQQLQQLIDFPTFDLTQLPYQISFIFESQSEAIAWLLEWKVLLTKTNSFSNHSSIKYSATKKR
jgi:hypothetical protein